MMHRLAKLRPSGLVGLALAAFAVATALVALVWTPFDSTHADPADRLAGPSLTHLLGTDRLGRDILSRLMDGATVTLSVSVGAVVISALIGIPLGLMAGMRRGVIGGIIMRGGDLLLAFPALLLALLAGAAFGVSTASATIAIGVAGIPGFIRVTRSGTQQVITQDYIPAARLAGHGDARIAFVHVLPNIAGTLVVQASVALALAILAEAGLSFLGLGTPPPEASWGRMLQASQASLASDPQLALWPGLVIAATVLGFNLLGDGLRDALDIRSPQ